jgi:hypothetical protein
VDVMFPRLIAMVMAMLAVGCVAGPIDIVGLAPTGLRMGIVALWPLDDGAGTMAADRSINARNGTLTGGTWISGRFGGALHFEAGNEIMVPSFPQATPDWSVALWVRPPAGDFGGAFVTLISTENVFIGGWEMNAMLMPTDPRYQFGYYLGPGESDYLSFDCRCVIPQQWTHIAGVVDGAARTLSFYRDGVLQGVVPVAQPIKPGNTTLYMGRWQMPGRLFTGDLDDVVIYSRVLAAPEVLALARAAAPDPR